MASGAEDDVVKAAGGVLWRGGDDADGPVEVLLVHRPKYDDWSLPKGKLDSGESWEAAAAREVEEETGLRGRLGPELASSTYRDAAGRPKLVRYWAMTAEGGRFTPTREVDEIRWVPLAEAGSLLTHDRDRDVLDSLAPAVEGAGGDGVP